MGKLEKAEELFKQLEVNSRIKNFIAQANARYILFGVNEPIENFPGFRSNLNEGLDAIAYSYLSIGCYFAEYQRIDESIEPLKKAATIIEYNHFPEQNRNQHSSYHILVGALAYYASCQYSKAFILLKNKKNANPITGLLYLFLSKNYKQLSHEIDNILLDKEYISKQYMLVYDVLLARILSNLLLYLQFGNEDHLGICVETLTDSIELSTLDDDPSLWWIFRLLKIVARGFEQSSLWTNLSPLIEGKDVITDSDYLLEFYELPHFSGFIPQRQEAIEKFIGNLVFKDKNPVVELFISQRQSLNKILAPYGAVVSLPTSSGKTRIAEIAILQSLLDNPFSQILYLAPFRSLAFEIEDTLSQTFGPLGYNVSQLYGGAQFSSIDKILIENSNILIATPEKAKAIIRANDELASSISLIIMDEGHLLGADKRFVTNEMFVEELRHLMKTNEGKMILLSAVLPNSVEISNWITQKENQIVKSDWRPSSQRFGIIEYTGTNVNLEWKGEEPSFNRSFIKNVRTKKIAIAQTAIRLSSIGSVLIYVGRANMVMGQAKELFIGLVENEASDVDWRNDYDWERFELACIENDNNENILKYARKGIMCHSNSLPSEVRLCMERLLRKQNKSKYIVSTSTLAQGVNLGVSTVIFANVFITSDPISYRDFWNIAGRAGRAFIDTEGKILYVIDKTNQTHRWHRKISEKFFDHSNLESARSGLLTKIIQLKNNAETCGIDFEHLLELITENNFSQIPNTNGQRDEITDFFDWIDDSLLALNLAFNDFDLNKSSWVDDHFRQSLAFIQAHENDEEIISIIKARSNAVKRMAGNPENWKSHASSGIPLLSIVKIDELIVEIRSFTEKYLNSQMNFEDLINFLKSAEGIIMQLPSSHFRHNFTETGIDLVRPVWLSGDTIKSIHNSNEISNKYFGYTIPWVLNAISKKFRLMELEDEAVAFEELGVLCELGLPSFWAAKIYLSGVRSRLAAKELSLIFNEEIVNNSLQEIQDIIIQDAEILNGRSDCSDHTRHWVEILSKEKSPIRKSLVNIPDFKFATEIKTNSEILYCKSYNDSYFLCSPDYKDKIEVTISDEFPFDKIADIPGIFFTWEEDTWKMQNKNPHYQVTL